MNHRPTAKPRRRGTALLAVLPLTAGLLLAAPSADADDVLVADTTAPTVEGSVAGDPAVGDDGWYTSNSLTYQLVATDPDVDGAETTGVSFIDATVDGSPRRAEAARADLTVIGSGTHELAWSATDGADNTSPVGDLTVKIDSQNPSASITYPADGDVLSTDAADTALTECDDDVSGVASCVTTVDGVETTTLDLTPGAHTVVVAARDVAGLTSERERDYTVVAGSTTRLDDVVVHRKQPGSATVTLTSTDASGGTVKILDGKKKIAGGPVTWDATGATATVDLVLPSLSRGVHRLRAVYSGTDYAAGSRSAVVKVRVR